ncbi:hypothetical protein [Streptomyces sp. 8L]|uniref:hypothetical protein n=1 Tax=Streptomyces sp. 8L TaxID=2877242 RepID=UPI001CD6F2C9|nr:hypothetical protein [Streptomyces sp. 8L]MCA1222564.1 hypothetical protein [Streptomyces sp. 8L]
MLVLGEDSPLPETAADVADLAVRLREHVSRLGNVTPPGEATLLHAQHLCSGSLPDGHMPSRIHLIRQAEAVQKLITVVRICGAAQKPARRRRWWQPRTNVLRGSVFALAFACVVLAASLPRT